MKSPQIALACIVMLSLFAMHQCVSMDVQKVEKSNYGINVPTCYHGPCHALVPDC
ncbi:hypothetical protein N665_1212s0005 [Sinapis alba]|nr:hypothetical protein N665_1212s0005 [Sinapis alba]